MRLTKVLTSSTLSTEILLSTYLLLHRYVHRNARRRRPAPSKTYGRSLILATSTTFGYLPARVVRLSYVEP